MSTFHLPFVHLDVRPNIDQCINHYTYVIVTTSSCPCYNIYVTVFIHFRSFTQMWDRRSCLDRASYTPRHYIYVITVTSWCLHHDYRVHVLLIVRSPRKGREHHPVCTPLYLRDCNYVTVSLSHSPIAYPEYSNTNTAESVHHYTYVIVNTSQYLCHCVAYHLPSVHPNVRPNTVQTIIPTSL